MVIRNKLVLKKEKSPEKWVEAKQGDEGALSLDKRLFDEWEKLKKFGSKPDLVPPLPIYKENNAAKYPPEISFSSELKMKTIQEQLPQRLIEYAKDMDKLVAKYGPEHKDVSRPQKKTRELTIIHGELTKDSPNLGELTHLIKGAKDEIDFKFFSKANRILSRHEEVIKVRAKEININQKLKERIQRNRVTEDGIKSEDDGPKSTPSN